MRVTKFNWINYCAAIQTQMKRKSERSNYLKSILITFIINVALINCELLSAIFMKLTQSNLQGQGTTSEMQIGVRLDILTAYIKGIHPEIY